MPSKLPCVYILSSGRRGTLYIGCTSDLVQRIWQHKQAETDGFTKKYNVNCLVYYEVHSDMYSAITRERSMKGWRRHWKFSLIEKTNPEWVDLYEEII